MKKKILVFALPLLMVFNIAAQDFSFDDLGMDEGGASAEASSLTVRGTAVVPMRYSTGNMSDEDTYDINVLKDNSWEVSPGLDLELSYATERAEFKAALNIDEDITEETFDELSVTLYSDKITVKFGYQSVVWGKGDKLHVVDLMNPMDYSDFLNPDYLDRKVAVPMVDLKMPVGMSGQVEFAYVPVFRGSTLATDGAWMMNESAALKSLLTTAVTTQAVSDYANASGAASAALTTATLTAAATGDASAIPAAVTASAVSDGTAALQMMDYISNNSTIDAYLPDMNTLAYGQFGLHYTQSIGAVDLGATYYFGRIRTPSVYVTGTTPDDISVIYDILHVAGLEAAGVLAGFNLRGEVAMYMTEDMEGDDAQIINPSFNYVAGFDRNIPLHNLNLNLQATGVYTLFTDEIVAVNDVQAGTEEAETTLLVKLSDSFNHEKIKPDVTVVYSIEDEAGMVRPSIIFDTDGYLSFKVSGSCFFGDNDTGFGQFDDNDFIELEAAFRF
ncbi:MAG: hypothetical protein JEY99_18765 [Spirochaetales bacterium]|nr:hypothetical protein [Spirochaetales bacterium]